MTRRMAVLVLSVLFGLCIPAAIAQAAPALPTDGLAVTGVNILAPILIGLVMLVIGLGFTAWAFLRGGSARRRQDRHRTGV